MGMMYYYFDDYGDCFREKWFSCEDEACEYCDMINAEYFCSENDI